MSIGAVKMGTSKLFCHTLNATGKIHGGSEGAILEFEFRTRIADTSDPCIDANPKPKPIGA